MNCSSNFLNEKKKKLKESFIFTVEPRISTSYQSGTCSPPWLCYIFICWARAVVSWAFVSVGAALVTRHAPGPVFSCSEYFRRRSQAEIFFTARQATALQSFIPSFMPLLQFSPHLSLKKKKRQIWDLC